MKNKGIATLLAFFLGGIGVHKFYLGETAKAILFLLFFWTFIPALIALVNFISLIIMSDADFNSKYNSQVKGKNTKTSNKAESLASKLGHAYAYLINKENKKQIILIGLAIFVFLIVFQNIITELTKDTSVKIYCKNEPTIAYKDYKGTAESSRFKKFEYTYVYLDKEKNGYLKTHLKSWIKKDNLFLDNENPELKAYIAKEEEIQRKEYAKKHRAEMIERQFSAWDGSHIRLARLVKQNLNDPKSYEHVKTIYWDRGSYLIVSMTYRGKNAFGGTVTEYIKANVDLDGNILKVYQ